MKSFFDVKECVAAGFSEDIVTTCKDLLTSTYVQLASGFEHLDTSFGLPFLLLDGPPGSGKSQVCSMFISEMVTHADLAPHLGCLLELSHASLNAVYKSYDVQQVEALFAYARRPWGKGPAPTTPTFSIIYVDEIGPMLKDGPFGEDTNMRTAWTSNLTRARADKEALVIVVGTTNSLGMVHDSFLSRARLVQVKRPSQEVAMNIFWSRMKAGVMKLLNPTTGSEGEVVTREDVDSWEQCARRFCTLSVSEFVDVVDRDLRRISRAADDLLPKGPEFVGSDLGAQLRSWKERLKEAQVHARDEPAGQRLISATAGVAMREFLPSCEKINAYMRCQTSLAPIAPQEYSSDG